VISRQASQLADASSVDIFRILKLDQRDLVTVLDRQLVTRQSVVEILVEWNLADDEDIAQAASAVYNMPFLSVDEDFLLETEEVKLVPESLARRFTLVPVKKDSDRSLYIAMQDPMNLEALEAVRCCTGLEVRRVISSRSRILRAIDKYYTEDTHIERNLKDILDLETEETPEMIKDNLDANQLRNLANDAPVVRFVNLLLMQAVRDGASDIHFEPGEKSVTVRLRIDGVLREVTPPPKRLYQAIVSRIKILSDMDIAERRLPLDGRFMFRIQDQSIDVRVSSLPEVFGEKLVLRILDQSSLKVDMTDVGFEAKMLKRFQDVLHSPHGIILITGPTGSGKTTTLYSALNFAKTPERNIQTVEDPVEYQLDGVNQMSIKERIGLDFARCLRSILRQDPDVIMIGEMRDAETSSIAMRAALTGHLVLSTLHTNDSTSSFSRLRDMGVEPYLVAATVKLVISQRLIRRLCTGCKVETTPDPESIRMVASTHPEVRDWTFYKGEGCEICGGTGYKGRIAVLEFLEMSDALRELVLEGVGDTPVRKQAVKDGLETISINALRKLELGVTTIEEVLHVWPIRSQSEEDASSE
jgi:type IV pilus assembly protein PilB